MIVLGIRQVEKHNVTIYSLELDCFLHQMIQHAQLLGSRQMHASRFLGNLDGGSSP